MPDRPLPTPGLVSLRDNVTRSSSKTARFKLMRALDKEWESDFPFALVIGELASSEPPTAYLDFLAQALTRAIKKGQGRPTALVKTYFSHPSVTIGAKVRLAPVLIRLDGSPETLSLVASLAREAQSDSCRSSLLSALTLSRSPSPQLLALLGSMSASPNDWPLSLATVLPPLAQASPAALEPNLTDILTLTTDQRLFTFAARALESLPASSQKSSLQNLVRRRAPQFSSL